MTSTKTRGQTIVRLRTERGITQGELAAAIGIKTHATISAWENDRQDIDAANLIKLVEYFGVEPSVLGYEVPRTRHMDAASPPAWFTQSMEQQAAQLDAMHNILKRLARKANA